MLIPIKLFKKLKNIGKSPLCNNKPSRGFKVFGYCFPLCCRCTGIIIGALIGFCFYNLSKQIEVTPLVFIFMLPMVVDGMLQSLFKIESTNFRRIITGMMFGISLVYSEKLINNLIIQFINTLLIF